MKNSYLAITIGPIYKVIEQAQKTREVWMASYFFSFIMENIRKEAEIYGKIILPAGATTQTKALEGTGIYPDRLIMKLNDNNVNIDVNEKITKPAIKKCAEDLKISEQKLHDYLQIYYVVINENDLLSFEYKDKNGNNNTSIIHRLNFLLDNKELNAKYNSSNEIFFNDFFDNNTREKFYEIAFNNKRKKYPSILEISATQIINNKEEYRELLNKDDDETSLEEEQNRNEIINTIAQKFKYMAILRADGDNFGEVISNLKVDEIETFSNKLVDFSTQASKTIKDYGGTVIYIGGDDILCFAPVVNNNKNIFTLVKELNDCFHKVFNDDIYKKQKVSLSYGLSITYYKYPLNEALNLSNILLVKAKEYKDINNKKLKNCIAFQLLQHSGQYRESILEFGENKSFDYFYKMLNNFTEKEQLLQSLTYKLIEDKEMFLAIANDNDRIEGYFRNHFSHDEKNKKVLDFIDSVKNYLILNFHLFSNKEDALYQINSICRMLKFLDSDGK